MATIFHSQSIFLSMLIFIGEIIINTIFPTQLSYKSIVSNFYDGIIYEVIYVSNIASICDFTEDCRWLRSELNR